MARPLTRAAAGLGSLRDPVLDGVLEYADCGYGNDEEQVHRRTARAVSLLSGRFVAVGQRAMLRRVVVHWAAYETVSGELEPSHSVNRRIQRLTDTLRSCPEGVPSIRWLALRFWTADDDDYALLRSDHISGMPWTQLAALLELLAGRVIGLRLSISTLRLTALMRDHGHALAALNARTVALTVCVGGGPASDIVGAVETVLQHVGPALREFELDVDVMEGGEGYRPLEGSQGPVTLDGISLPRLRVLSYAAGVDNLFQR